MLRSFSLPLFLAFIVGSSAKFTPTSAQVTSDGTTSTTVNVDGNKFEINDGDRAGSNLFHSFRDFSIPNGGSAFFNNNADIANIFSRVTGGNISNIDGLIRTNDASLFLINPAGIIFGTGARLDLGGGSFYGSTADSILFEDGEFSATDLDNPPLLTVNAPIGLNLRENPGAIRSTANDVDLEVNAGENITLVGGDINFEGGKVSAPGGRVELGGLSAAGTVTFNDDGSLNFPDGISRSDISFTNNAVVDVRADGGGFISINAQNLELRAGSQLTAGIGEEVNSPEAQAGDINLNIVESITIDGVESGIFNHVGELNTNNEEVVRSNTVGNAGKIDIETGSLFITPGGRIGSTVFGEGNASDITVNARENVEIQGFEENSQNSQTPTRIFSTLEDQAKGNTGTIRISSNSLVVRDRGELRTSTGEGAEGSGGDINVDIGSLTLDNVGRFIASIGREGEGTGGDIVIDADTVSLNEGARLTSELGREAVGNAGNIVINADTVSLNGFTLQEDSRGGNQPEIEVEVEDNARGNAGNIEINANSLSLSGNSDLESTIDIGAEGNAGNIIIKTGLFSLDTDAQITTSTAGAKGNAGRVEIDADTVRIDDGARIVSNTTGQGNAGTIEVKASDSVTISGFGDLLLLNRLAFNDTETEGGASGLFSSVASEASGQGGNITISTPNLKISDGAVISANVATQAQGTGGNILINANTLEISNGGQIIASSLGDGDSGEINLNISDSIEIFGSDPNFSQRFQAEERTRVTNNSVNGEIILEGFLTEEQGREQFSFVGIGESSQFSGIFADNEGQGSGGTVSIQTDSLTLDDGARISASTKSGQGGNITFRINDILSLNNNSFISARAFEEASGGNLTIDTNFIIAFPNQNNDIIANAEQGNGGNIDINAEALFGIEERPLNPITNDINASSELGLEGSVSINTPDVNALETDIDLPNNPIENEQSVAQACRRDIASGKVNGLVVKGKGGIPPEPTAPMDSDAILVDGKITNLHPQVQSLDIKPVQTSIGDIYPARGIMVSESGEVILTAYPTENDDSRLSKNLNNCQI